MSALARMTSGSFSISLLGHMVNNYISRATNLDYKLNPCASDTLSSKSTDDSELAQEMEIAQGDLRELVEHFHRDVMRRFDKQAWRVKCGGNNFGCKDPEYA